MMKCKKLLISALSGVVLGGYVFGWVPAADVTLRPVVSENLPVYYCLSGYVNTEAQAGDEIDQQPLYKPYDNTTAGWWDNLVAEQLQARLPVIMCATRGSWTTNVTDITGPGNMNPRRLTALTDAFARANVGPDLMKITCFVDSPAFRGIYTRLKKLKSDSKLDLSDPVAWNDVYWLRGIKPWFDTIPSNYWFRVDNRPLIQFWGFHPSWCSSHKGNISRMLTFIANEFESCYGVRPYFIMPQSVIVAGNQDATVATQADVYGFNGWFTPPARSWSIVSSNAHSIGCAAPGFIDPNFFKPGSHSYTNCERVISRRGTNDLRRNGDTLEAGLAAGMQSRVKLMMMEGWTDVSEGAGLYRSLHKDWDSPNQYINIIRSYSDLRTETLRLEAEGADAFCDTTANNAGEAFRRSGDLDIRASADGKGWQIGWTAPGEWIEFRGVYLSPGTYSFPVRYACSSPQILNLVMDGISLGDVAVAGTGGSNTFDTITLGRGTVPGGAHTIRLTFVSGGVDVDWIFVRKTDVCISLKSLLNGKYVSAKLGGGDAVAAEGEKAGNWERFVACDKDGGDLMAGDILNLQCHNGLFLSAESGGGGALSADRLRDGEFEKFVIVKIDGSGGTLADGDAVALVSCSGNYVSVDSNGVLNVSSVSMGTAQTFNVELKPE